MSPGMRNDRKVRKGSTMSCRMHLRQFIARLYCSSPTDHQLCFPLSDVKGSFALNEPGVHPDLCVYMPLS